MIKFNIIGLFPEIVKSVFNYGVLSRALEKKCIEFNFINPRDFATGTHLSVDDRPYGGGDGMVLLAPPFKKALQSLTHPGFVCYLSPQGSLWKASKAKKWASEKKQITFICGRYGGLDERFIQKYVDEQISIGDYVLTGGEVACCVVVDSICRFIPEVLGHKDSAEKDSFTKSTVLEGPAFTRPYEFESERVPDVFLNGNHKQIEEVRYHLSLIKTSQKRPELLTKKEHSDLLSSWEFLKKTLTDEEIKICGIILN